MKRTVVSLLGILAFSALLLLNAAAKGPAHGLTQEEQPTPVPYRQLIYDGTVTLDREWCEQHQDEPGVSFKRVEVPIPGPGYIWFDYKAYRLDCPEGGCWCAYGGEVNFYIRNSSGQILDFWEWTDGGTVIVDTCQCLSSNLDLYEYQSEIKVYWDPDSDADKVPDWRDECPNTYVETSDPDHSNGCPPPTPEPSPTPEPTPAVCNLELYVSPENLSAGEVAYLTLRAFYGTGEPIAGDLAQVAILDGPGDILEEALITDEYGEAEFTYQAPADVAEPVTVQVMATVGGCPDDAATAYISLQPAERPTPIPSPTFTPSEASIDLEVADTNPAGQPYTAIAADGITQLRLVAHLSGPITPDQVSWELTSDTEEEPGVLHYVQSTSPDVSIRAFEPWQVFDKPYTVQITAKVQAPNGQVLSDAVSVQVVRTPVILIHGIWSNRSSMTTVAWALKHTGQFEFAAVDYGSAPKKSNQDIRLSVKYLTEGVDRILDKLNNHGIKVSRVDIVAHSMGGLVSRLYIVGDGQSIPPHPDKVRRLVTLSTPHGGSPVADWYSDLIANRSVVCDSDPTKFDKTKVTENEINWFIREIRRRAGLAPGALEFGEAVRQMQTRGNPGSIVDLLTARQTQVNVRTEYYTIAGNKPLATWLKKVGGYDAVRLSYMSWQGPCGESWRPAMEDMVKEFLELITLSDADGVVLEASALGTGTGIKPEFTHVVPANHFDITGNGWALDAVLNYLTDHQVWLGLGMSVISHSPGHLHVYDENGRHVGLAADGQIEIGIEGAEYEAFSDTTGDHELIWVPQDEGIVIQFLANKEGTAGIDISQGRADGLHWFSYEDIEVKPGSEVTIQLTSSGSEGHLAHPDGEEETISPTHTAFELPPESFEPTPGTSEPLTGFQPLAGLLPLTCCGLVAVVGVGVSVFVFARRHPFAKWILVFLGGFAVLLIALTCLIVVLLAGQQEGVSPNTPLPTTPVPTHVPAMPTPTSAPIVMTPTPEAMQVGTVVLVNQSEQDVCFVYIAPTESEDWGEDWLGEDEVISPGATRTFTVTVGTYDLLAADCAAEVLSEQYEVTVSGTVEWEVKP